LIFPAARAAVPGAIELSPKIDPHDLSVKLEHAIGFLCEDMKVKIMLKFRGREMARGIRLRGGAEVSQRRCRLRTPGL
jgi:translation initiation factor IF-3